MAFSNQDDYLISYGRSPSGGGCSPLFYAFGVFMAALFFAPYWVRALGWIGWGVFAVVCAALLVALVWVLRLVWATVLTARINRSVLRERCEKAQSQAHPSTTTGPPVNTAPRTTATTVRPPRGPLN